VGTLLVRPLGRDYQRVAAAIIEKLNPAFTTHLEEGSIQLVGIAFARDHRQEFFVG
jgi:hypothetical protein